MSVLARSRPFSPVLARSRPFLSSLTVFATIMGCASTSMDPSPSVVSEDRFIAETVLRNEGEPPRSLGQKVWTRRTIEATRMLPMSEIHVDDHGNLIGFKPALPPLEGVEEPPFDIPLENVTFRNGRLATWSIASSTEMLPKCRVRYIPGGIYSYANLSCLQPTTCLLELIYDDNGNLISADCYCIEI
jgi:hypothetical protein